jgi:hypothetical protein
LNMGMAIDQHNREPLLLGIGFAPATKLSMDLP